MFDQVRMLPQVAVRPRMGQAPSPTPSPAGGQQAPGVQPQTVSFQGDFESFFPWPGWWGWPYGYPYQQPYGPTRQVCRKIGEENGQDVLECRQEPTYQYQYPYHYQNYPVYPLFSGYGGWWY